MAIGNGDYSLSQTMLGQFIGNYPEKINEISTFDGLKQFEIDIFSDNRNWSDLTEKEIGNLNQIANNGYGIAKIQSQNILNFFYGMQFEDELDLTSFIDESPSNRIGTKQDVAEEMPKENLLIYPNPTTLGEKMYIVFQEEVFPEVSYSIYNLNMHQVQSGALQSSLNGINLDGLPTGIYFIKISNASNTSESIHKFIIQ